MLYRDSSAQGQYLDRHTGTVPEHGVCTLPVLICVPLVENLLVLYFLSFTFLRHINI